MLPPPLAPDVSAALQLVITGLLLIYGAVLVVRHAASRYFVASFAEGYNHRHPMSFIGGGSGGGGGGAVRDGLCVVCGEEGNKKCSRCKTARYCSHECQSKHWEAGHKLKCKRTSLSDVVDTSSANGSSRRRTSSGFSSISLVPAHGSCKVLKEPKKILFPYDEFVKLFNWDKPGFRPCGLVNCGNSCFANVILQCLASTRPLTAYLLEREHSRFCIRKQDDWCFLCELQVHIRRASESSHPFSPHNILSRLPNIGGNLGYGRQEDAHEFMRFAIDTMQSICLDEFGGEKALDPSSQETTLIQYTFGGHLRSQVTCMECNMVSNRYENMMDLTVEILGDAESLEDCLNQFTAKEFLDGENMYKCDGCNDYVKAWKRLTVHQAPNILTIALKRFQSGRFGKLNKRVTFPEVLDLTPYMSGNGDGTDLYTLYAVVVHLDMLNASFFGHYICYTKDSHGQWYRIDDCKVMNVEVEEVLAQGAYMLLYSRKNARQEPLIKPMEPESKKHSSKSEHVSSTVTDAANHRSVPACVTDDVASQLNVYSHEKSVDVSSLRDTSHERESSIDASHESELSIVINATKRAEPESVALDAPEMSVVIDAMKGTEPESMDLDEPLEENSMPVCKGLGDMHVDGKLLAMQEGKDLRVENPGFSSCAPEDAVAVDPIYSSSIAQGNVSTTQFPAVESKLSDATQSSDCCLQEYRQSMNIREKAASDDFSGNGCVINSSQVEEPLVDSKPDLEHPGAVHSPLDSANGAVRQSSPSSMNGTKESKALELSWVESRQRKSKPLFAYGFLDTTAKKKLVAPGARTQIGNHVGITPEANDCSNGHLKLAFVQNSANNISGCGKDSPIYDASFLSSGSVNESCGNSFNEGKVVREESDRMGHSHCNGCAEWASSCQNDSKDDRVKMCCLNGKTSPSEDYERPLLSSHSLDNIPAVESDECHEDLGGTNIKNNNKGVCLGNGYDKSSYGCLGDGLKSVDVLHPTKLGSPGRFNKLIASDVRSNSIDYEGPLLSSHSLDNMSSKKRVLSQEELGSTDMEGHNK